MFSPKQTIPNLYVLDAYCIENFIIDEEAVCNTLCNFIGTKELKEIKTKFNFNNLIDNHKDALISLFYHKALEQKFKGHFYLYSLATYYDCSNNLDIQKIRSEQDDIKKRLATFGISEDTINEELELMESKFPKNVETFLKIISGKDYLLHLISCHAKKSLDYRTGHTKESWKYNFAQHCRLDRLEHLKTTILGKFPKYD